MSCSPWEHKQHWHPAQCRGTLSTSAKQLQSGSQRQRLRRARARAAKMLAATHRQILHQVSFPNVLCIRCSTLWYDQKEENMPSAASCYGMSCCVVLLPRSASFLSKWPCAMSFSNSLHSLYCRKALLRLSGACLMSFYTGAPL